MLTTLRPTFVVPLFAIAALSASPVLAQDEGAANTGAVTERIVVSPTGATSTRGRLGAPIVDVSASRNIRVDDLDLSTSEGVATLRSRVNRTARNLCRRLDILFPLETQNSARCFRNAVNQAMEVAMREQGQSHVALRE